MPHPSWGPSVVVEGLAVPAIAESHWGPRISGAAECQSANGTWGVVGESSEPRCIVPTTDGALSCSDHAQCQGLCPADWVTGLGEKAVGQCAATYYEIGCRSWVYGGRVGQRVCLE